MSSARIEQWTGYGVGGVQAEQIGSVMGEEFSLQAQSQDWDQRTAEVSVPRRAPHAWSLEAFFTFLEAAHSFLRGSILRSRSFWVDMSWIPLCWKSNASAYELAGFEDWGLVKQFLSLKDPLVSNPQELAFILELEDGGQDFIEIFFFSLGFGGLELDSWPVWTELISPASSTIHLAAVVLFMNVLLPQTMLQMSRVAHSRIER